MRPYLFRGLLALLVALAFSAPAAAQSVIRGKVVDAQGKAVEGGSVTVGATRSTTSATSIRLIRPSRCSGEIG